MALTKISTGGVKDDAVTSAKIPNAAIGGSEIANDSVDAGQLKTDNTGSNGQFLRQLAGGTGGLAWADVASEGTEVKSTGESGTTKFLRVDGDGTSSWQVPPDTVYTHPNHSGEVTSTADGAQVISSDVVDEDNLKISNAGTNGQYLQKQSGNTGGLTWADVTIPPAGNTFTAVADGAITAGKPVQIKSNGKVEEIKKSFSEASLVNRGYHTAQSDRGRFPRIAYDPTNKKAVMIWSDQAGGWTCKYIVYYNVNADTISSGAEIPQGSIGYIASGAFEWNDLIFDSNAGKFVFSTGKNPSGSRGQSYVGTVNSNNTMSWSSSGTWNSATSGEYQHRMVYCSNANRFVILYNDGNAFKSIVGSLSGSTITWGSATTLTYFVNMDEHFDVDYDPTTNKVLCVYKKWNSATNRGFLLVGDVSTSANTVTFGGENEIHPSSNLVNSPRVAGGNGMALVQWADASNSDRELYRTATLNSSNTNITWNGYNSGPNHPDGLTWHRACWNSIINKWVWSYTNGGQADGYDWKIIKGTQNSNGTITWDTSNELTIGTTNAEQIEIIDLQQAGDAGMLTVGQRDGESNDPLHTRFITAGGSTSNFAGNEHYMGYPDQAYSNGQTATIKTYGNNISGLSGLTAGTRYYVQSDGTLGTSSDVPVARAGIALAADKLLIQEPTNWGG